MKELLSNASFISFLSLIVSVIIAPVIIEEYKKHGAKQKEQFEKVVDKIEEQSSKIDRIDKELRLQGQAMLGTMRYELISAMSTAVKRKYTTTKEIEDINDLLEPYRKLGGNGTVDTMYIKFTKLPINDNGGDIL